MSASNKALLAEFAGLFCFTFIGAGAICTTALTHGEPGLVGIALAHGLMMAINIAGLGQFSGGHFNPAVTIALWSTGRCGTTQAVRYVAAQLAGSALAAFALRQAFPAEVLGAGAYLGATLPGGAVTAGQAAWIEFILTFILVTAVFNVAVSSGGARNLAPFAIGLTIGVDILAAGPLTGASMNPARSFGPQLITGNWQDAWIYYVGPILGGLAAGWVSHHLLLSGGAKRK